MACTGYKIGVGSHRMIKTVIEWTLGGEEDQTRALTDGPNYKTEREI